MLIVHILFLFVSYNGLLAQNSEQKSNIELSLSYSSQFIAFIESYRDNKVRLNINGAFRNTYFNSDVSKKDLGDNSETNPSRQVISNKSTNVNSIQAYVNIPEQNKHIQMQVFMGSRLQPYKLSFDLNYPYIWVKSPNCTVCSETFSNTTNTTLPTPKPTPALPVQNKSQNIQNIYRKEIVHRLSQQSQQQGEVVLTNCTDIKQYIQKGNFFTCDPKNTTCRLLQSDQQIRYTTPRTVYLSQNSTLQQFSNDTSKYVIGDLVNDAITFSKDVVTILFHDFYVINKEVNIEPADLAVQNDGFIGFPIIKNYSIVQKLYNQKTISRNSFSLYLYYEPTNAIQPCVILGDNNKNYYQGDFNYTKMWNFENKYAFHFKQLKLGNVSFHNDTQSATNQSATYKYQKHELKKELKHRDKTQLVYQNFQQQNTTNNTSVPAIQKEYVGILSTQEFLIKFPENVINNLMKVMKDSHKIRCRKDTNSTVECIKDKNSTMPDLSIEVNHPDPSQGNTYIHLKGEWYIWECKSPSTVSELKPYNSIDSKYIQDISRNLTQYQICSTFFQVSDNRTFNQFYFGFSFMERFYIEFDLEKETLAFSQSVRKSQFTAIVPSNNFLYALGPLILLVCSFYYCFSFQKKSKNILAHSPQQQIQMSQNGPTQSSSQAAVESTQNTVSAKI